MDITAKHPRPARSRATPAAASRTLLLATDLQQSILAELERSSPNRRAYSAYGVPGSQRPTSARLGFNGQITERSTGWYHLGNGHRVYNPVLMRFHSPDRLSPFGKGGINAYAYCKADPINFTDPSGMFITAAFSQLYQRISTAVLHVGIPAGLLLAPRASGAALGGTRASLIGSALSATGALLQVGGVSSGMYVANVGITLSVGGLFTRVGATAHQLYQSGNLWTRFKDNVKNVFGFSGSKPGSPPTVIPPPPPSPPVQIEMGGVSPFVSGQEPVPDMSTNVFNIRQGEYSAK